MDKSDEKKQDMSKEERRKMLSAKLQMQMQLRGMRRSSQAEKEAFIQ